MNPASRICSCLAISFFFFVTIVLSVGTCFADANIMVKEGIVNLFVDKDVQQAQAKFNQALVEDSNHQGANFFYAFTRIAILSNNPDVNVLLDRFGITGEGRNPLAWTADFTSNDEHTVIIPEDAPSPNDITDCFNSIFLPEIQGALANLSKVNTSFNMVLSMADTGSDTVIEIDYGDAALFRSGLYGISALIQILESHDLSLNIHDLSEKITTIESYPDFFKLLSTHNLPAAKNNVKMGIDSYFIASEFIRNEQDDQYNDFIAFDPDFLEDEQRERLILAQIVDSLDGPVSIGDSDSHDPVYLNLSYFFSGSIDINSYLPDFINNSPVSCTMPDPTIGGTLPHFTHDSWAESLSMIVPVSGIVSCPSWTVATIHIFAFENPYPYSDRLVSSIDLAGPGTYTIYVPYGKTAYVRGFWDKNEDGVFSPGDYSGVANFNTGIEVGACGITGVDLNLEEFISVDQAADGDADGDVDGRDLAQLAIMLQAGANTIPIQEFASAFGAIAQ